MPCLLRRTNNDLSNTIEFLVEGTFLWDATQILLILTMIRLLRKTNNESGITIEFLVEGICIAHNPYTVDLYYALSLAEDEQCLEYY